MTTVQRWIVFNTVGVVGFALQMAMLWVLVRLCGLPPAAAAPLAIELTVLHNFAWHVAWTWRDRPCPPREMLARLVRFNVANGAISLVGGTLIVWTGTSVAGLHFLVANVIAVAVCALLNFLAGDRWAFRQRHATAGHQPLGLGRRAATLVVAVGAMATAEADAATLSPETRRAFASYVAQVEAQIATREGAAGPFLWLTESADRVARAKRGEVVVERLTRDGPVEIPGGLVHDWIGGAWIGGATREAVLALITDVDRHAAFYAPEVARSRLVGRQGDTIRSYLRLVKHKIITVVLDTEHVAEIRRLGPARGRSWSRSVRIVEVDNAGQADERLLPAGEGHGFLWALNSYWRIEEVSGGIFIECRAISLTRRIPTGLGWLIGPIVSGLPRDSLVSTLAATRAGITGSKAR